MVYEDVAEDAADVDVGQVKERNQTRGRAATYPVPGARLQAGSSGPVPGLWPLEVVGYGEGTTRGTARPRLRGG
jgi:hypothetical protein